MVLAVLVSTALATTQTFDPVIPTADSQATGVWYTDRYAPQVFKSTLFDGDNRLQLGLRSAGQQANREAHSGDFYNYQGRKYDTANALTGSSVSIEMYVDSNWTTGSRAGMWTTMANGNLTYPIIEWVVGDANSHTGFRYWQSFSGWTEVDGTYAQDAWHKMEIQLHSTQVEFYIDDVLIESVSNLGAESVENVILQGHNQGVAGEYDIYYDNFTIEAVGAIPEPLTIAAVFGGVSALGGYVRRRRRA
jgi:hypothetical protein